MDLIIADELGSEVAFLFSVDLRLDIGSTNDYVLRIPVKEWESAGYSKGYRFYMPGTEYGGIIQNIGRPADEQNIIVLSGDIWRGMLSKKIIVPPAGQAYLTVSGDANAIIRDLVGGQFGDIFTVLGDSSITISNYSFDRYTDILSGLTKMLLAYDARLDFRYVQGASGTGGHVEVRAVPIVDYSGLADYSDDYDKIRFSAYEVGNGINHLICLGKGELEARTVAHLYVDNEGNIVDKPYYTGLDERVAVYDYGSAETPEELVKGGKKRLKELMSYNKFVMHVSDDLDIPAAIGDIVGGRERTSGILIRQQVRQEILRYDGRKLSIEYTVGDIEKNNGTNVGGGEADYTGDIDDLNQKTDVLDTAVKDLTVKKLDAETAAITYATIINLDAATARIGKIEADYLSADAADLKYASITELDAVAGRIDTLESTMITTDYLDANYLTTQQLAAKYATIQNLNAETAKIGTLQTKTAEIDALLAGNITAANIKSGSITTDRLMAEDGWITNAMIAQGAIENAQIADGSITDAKIVGLTANKITAGRMDAAEIEVVNLNAANITVGTINGQQIAPGAIDLDKLGSDVTGVINDIDIAAQAAQKTADGKNTIFYQSTAPDMTNCKVNDIWYDTDNDYKMHHYNGTSWVPDAFGSGALADNAIKTEHLGEGVITAQQLKDGVVTRDKIALGAIVADRLNVPMHILS